MSTPHIAWAFAQRELTAIQRLVLIALAERANGELTCFPSETTLACNCELSRRSVVAAVRYLHTERHLIEIVTDPVERAAVLAKAGAKVSARVNVYRILRPANGASGAPSNSARHAPSKASNSANRAPSKPPVAQTVHHAPPIAQMVHHTDPGNGANGAPAMCKPCTSDSAPRAHEPLTESLHEKKTRASAPEAGKILSAGKQEESKQAPPTPPVPPATPGSDDFNSYLDAPASDKALPCEIEQEVISADPLDLPVDPEYVRATVAALKHEWRMRAYPGRAATMSADDQIDAVLGKPQPQAHHLAGAHLAAMRRQAGIRHAADA